MITPRPSYLRHDLPGALTRAPIITLQQEGQGVLNLIGLAIAALSMMRRTYKPPTRTPAMPATQPWGLRTRFKACMMHAASTVSLPSATLNGSPRGIFVEGFL